MPNLQAQKRDDIVSNRSNSYKTATLIRPRQKERYSKVHEKEPVYPGFPRYTEHPTPLVICSIGLPRNLHLEDHQFSFKDNFRLR